MKKFITKLLVLVTAVVCCCSFAACKTTEPTSVATVKVTVYKGAGASEEVTLKFDLYKKLAPKSVEKITAAANSGYYDNMFFYEAATKAGSSFTGVKAFGEVKYVNGKVTLTGADENGEIVVDNQDVENNRYIPGEFANGGTVGSDKEAKIGSVLVWHWGEANESGTLSQSQFNTGYENTSDFGMLMIPTVSGQFKDTENGSTTVTVAGDVQDDYKDALRLILGLTVDSESYDNYDSENMETYHIFYSLETAADGIKTLVKKLLTADEYEDLTQEDLDKIYNPLDKDMVIAGYDYSKYQERTVKAPKYEYRIVINSVTVKK